MNLNLTYLAGLVPQVEFTQDTVDQLDQDSQWSIVAACHDIPELDELHNCDQQLSRLEQEYLDNNYLVPPNCLASIDAGQLLNIDGKVGLKCPRCQDQETTYKLQAVRSADEGMTAICACRSCRHEWRITM